MRILGTIYLIRHIENAAIYYSFSPFYVASVWCSPFSSSNMYSFLMKNRHPEKQQMIVSQNPFLLGDVRVRKQAR